MLGLMIVLRLFHIFSAVFWAGSAFTMAGFVEPAANDLGPDGGKFMMGLIKHNYSTALAIAGGLTVLSGITMYWILSAGLTLGWIKTGTGLSLTVGGIAGILAMVTGIIYQGNASKHLGAIMGEIQSSGGPPKSDQIAEINRLRERLAKGGLISVVLFTIAIAGMAIAQYAHF